MTDRTPSIFKPIHAQFRAAWILFCGIITTGALTATAPAETGNAYAFPKSSAQVASWVGPQVAPPNSCGLKPKRKRASPVKVRLNEAEKELVQVKAAKAGMSVNAFIKCVAISDDYDPTKWNTLRSLNLEFTRQGVNLNQIARQRNSNLITETETDSMLGIIPAPICGLIRQSGRR